MVLFLKKVRLLRYMEMREPLGTKCSGRASQRRVSRNDLAVVVHLDAVGRASQRRVSRNDGKDALADTGPASRLAEARE